MTYDGHSFRLVSKLACTGGEVKGTIFFLQFLTAREWALATCQRIWINWFEVWSNGNLYV